MSSLRTIFRLVLGLTILFWSIAPIGWMMLASMRERRELLLDPSRLIPDNVTSVSYKALFDDPGFVESLGHSLLLATAATVIALLFAATASYSLARYRVRGMKAVEQASLWSYLFAPVVLVLPLFILLQFVSLLDTLWGLILAYVAFCFPFAMWLLYPFMSGLPYSLEEAAAADGASPTQTLRRIILPVAKPGFLAVGAFCFAVSWSDYLFARVLLSGERKTVPVYIYDLSTSTVVDWGKLMAAGTIAVVPVILLFLLVHRQLTAGIAGAGVKG